MHVDIVATRTATRVQVIACRTILNGYATALRVVEGDGFDGTVVYSVSIIFLGIIEVNRGTAGAAMAVQVALVVLEIVAAIE